MKEFSIVRKGYNPEEVNAYILELETALANKTQTVKEFQGMETAIASSIVDARMAAEDIRRKSADEAQKMHEDAVADAEKIHENAVIEAGALRTFALNEMNDLRDQVLAFHDKLQGFQDEFGRILQEYLISFRSNDLVALFSHLENFMSNLDLAAPKKDAEEEPEAAPEAVEEAVEETVETVEEAVRAVEETVEAAEEITEVVEEAAEEIVEAAEEVKSETESFFE